MTKEIILNILITICVTIIVLLVGIKVVIPIYDNYENICDIKYGWKNWTTIEITGTKEANEIYPFYIGQVWSCVPIE